MTSWFTDSTSTIIYWYLAADPVANGFELGHLAVLAGASVVLVVAAALLFERRDLAS